MRVPLLDLRPGFTPALREDILRELTSICDEQGFILGPRVQAFEAELAAYTGSAHALGVSSGTDAQLVLLMAMGIGAGDAVLTTPYTFFATAGCIHRVGATPVFLDIERDGFNLSPAAVEDYLRNTATRDAEGALRTPAGQRIRAIAPVHLFGQCADMDALLRLGREYDLPVIEDAAQALGADYVDAAGKVSKAGATGYAGWYSFYPSKNLGAFGDAGATAHQDAALDERMRSHRNHGQTEMYRHAYVGGNFRLDAMQAAVLRLKLPLLDGWCDGRRQAAQWYREAFAATKLGAHGHVTLPRELWGDREAAATAAAATGQPVRAHIYNQFVIRAQQRDALRQHLSAREIGNQVYYPLSLHQQECFAYLGHRTGDFPESERAAQESLALPMFPDLTQEQVAYVVEGIAAFYAR